MQDRTIPDSALISSATVKGTTATDVRMGEDGVCFNQNKDNFVKIDVGKVHTFFWDMFLMYLSASGKCIFFLVFFHCSSERGCIGIIYSPDSNCRGGVINRRCLVFWSSS